MWPQCEDPNLKVMQRELLQLSKDDVLHILQSIPSSSHLRPTYNLRSICSCVSVLLIHIRNCTILGLLTVAILGPFSAHFRLIFVYLAEKQTKGNEKWDEKWCEKWLLWNPRNGNYRKMKQKCIFPFRHTAKKMKMIVFRVHFCKSKVRVPFYIHFSFILSFNFEKKWKQNEMENDWKMIEKWTKNANCEQPYFTSQTCVFGNFLKIVSLCHLQVSMQIIVFLEQHLLNKFLVLSMGILLFLTYSHLKQQPLALPKGFIDG